MLPASSRMRAASDFQFVMRRGSKSGRKTAVVYLARTGDATSMAGFAVSKAVGGAVIRNRVKRRMRAIMAELLPTLPPGSGVVVRALPASADATFAQLHADLSGALAAADAKVAA
ncbi:ribonuclease P protein component [Demequina aurantiaca]|uniref:ribonuclease P protein component n=1 Tax=Demequina aurantiaca TaxID=676200 RepID=UPI0007842D95|nr:ribonuclease P protein component [Demequina aurantiaca]